MLPNAFLRRYATPALRQRALAASCSLEAGSQLLEKCDGFDEESR